MIFRYGMLKLDLLLLKDQNCVQLFRRTVGAHPGKTAFIDVGSGKRWTYQEVHLK